MIYPQYPLIVINCEMEGRLPFYIADEIATALAIGAPRDTFKIGTNGHRLYFGKRWRKLRKEPFKTILTNECLRRFGVHPNEL